ncbi:hypothetical protein QFZ82_007597 [Streptomyces sp. V4I23]|nr:hypothetical protein [Streptomyces sp. V4I23]
MADLYELQLAFDLPDDRSRDKAPDAGVQVAEVYRGVR